MAAMQDAAGPSRSSGRAPKPVTICGDPKAAALFALGHEDSAVIGQWERKCVCCATLILLVLLILVLAISLYSPPSTRTQGTSTAAPVALVRWRALPETVAAATDDDDEAFGQRATIRRHRVGPSEGGPPDATLADEKDANVTAVAEVGNEQRAPPVNEMGKDYEWG